MINGKIAILALLISFCNLISAQNVPVLSYSINNSGQVELEIEGRADEYYLLTAQHEPNLNYESVTSMTLGTNGIMTITEPLAAFALQSYKITAHSITNPDDTDGDGDNDVFEFNNMPFKSALNYAREIPMIDGTASINTSEVFTELAVVSEDIPWAPFLNDQEFVKFAIVNQGSNEPEIYFINSKTHEIHADFLDGINVDQFGDDVVTGEIVFNPNEILPNGVIGSYSFNYSFGDAFPFEHSYRTFDLLAKNMPFLQNNLQHFIGDVGEDAYNNVYKSAYTGSRLNVILESEFFADVDYLPFNKAEGYGFFRKMTLDENPGSRDIVLYDALPNSLPRVGGIMTSVIQTPLSHVNLRAIQDNLPNAYIKEPLQIDSISNLLGKYIYYKVDQDYYEIREASLEEVNEWYEKIRPTEPQIPERDLSQTEILPLDSIEFEMSIAFGAKCTNVATMRKFGFPDNTIPDGFGIPFYYYDEFMKFNDFYSAAREMLADPGFISDLETRIEMLKDFRKLIKDADMPLWMLDDLQAMHDAFPEGTAVRCRSSTNNEDLPGFSGAGLYTSKTQHLDEGHISKSVKQVYASMWNFRAYDERDFYRVDHFIAAMGILCHPNYQEEKSNGVGVSIDPIYQTANTFYLNTQVGESLITNPDENAIPEEILLSEDPNEGYFVLRNSNLVPNGELVMNEGYLEQMRDYLKVIHDEFEVLYNVVGAEGFGMDIEYKVTKQDQLIIKQARPWVSFWAEIKANFDLAVAEITDPISSSTLSNTEMVTARIENRGLRAMQDFEISLIVEDQIVETISISDNLEPQSSAEYQFMLPQDFSTIGDYQIGAIVNHPSDGYATNDTLKTTISKLHLLEGGIVAMLGEIKCGEEIEAIAQLSNYGESTFSNTEIQVIVNGMVVDTFNYGFNIPYLATVDIFIPIVQNLQANNNVIELNLLSVNGEADAIISNNFSSFMTDLDSDNNYITFIINADDYPEETSWAIVDESTGNLTASGSLSTGQQILREDICLNYNSCFTLYVYDAQDDGICCGYGIGDFLILNTAGDTLLTNDGDFGSEAKELFCPNGKGCVLEANIETINASAENVADGIITIFPQNGMAPFEYSIDDGQNFSSNNQFDNLTAGQYAIVVRDATEDCTYEETITLNFDMTSSTSEISSNHINIFPNPTEDELIIHLNKEMNVFGEMNLVIYNTLGRIVYSDVISITNGELRKELSLSEQVAGSYIVKCFNADFEAFIKIIKI